MNAAQSGTSRSPKGLWTHRKVLLLTLMSLVAGIVTGYALRGPAPAEVRANAAAPAPEAVAVKPNSPQALESLAAPLVVSAQADPKNADVQIQLGNFYSDHRAYVQAIEYYERALALRPNNVNVRTDLGTAYWYSGSAAKAIAEYEKALAARPNYAPTLMNLGIVQYEGLKEPRRAADTWRKLLETNPNFNERQRVLNLIVEAEKKLQ